MHESPGDIVALQGLLDRSYAGAGAHLLRIHTPERRLSAEQVIDRLSGASACFTLATVTTDCRPIVGPVEAEFLPRCIPFRLKPRLGALSAHPDPAARQRDPCSRRRARDHSPRTCRPGEHTCPRGSWIEASAAGDLPAEVRSRLGGGVPRLGPVYARIEPDRMFTFACRRAIADEAVSILAVLARRIGRKRKPT